jgi:hypothetical protein
MSEHEPPSGAPEYLESGGGRPLAPGPAQPDEAPSLPRRRRRTPWVAAIAAVLLLGGGAVAWAALSFFRQGAQPAEALPASTIAYAGLDLDPSGSQKIDAFKTLNRFPAFRQQVGVDSVDDVRRTIGEGILDGLRCHGMTYHDDIDPWLGQRAAVAAVDVGRDAPALVLVVQVTDDDRARGALQALSSCDDVAPADHAFRVDQGWALLSDSQDDLDSIAAARDRGTLADDPTYRTWVDRLGDSGVVTMYAAPKAGTYLADGLDRWTSVLADPGSVLSTPPDAGATSDLDPDGTLAQELRDFSGAAATIRFTGHGLELAVVSDAHVPGVTAFAGDQAGAGVTRLPDDTAAALGISLQPGWVQALVDRVRGSFGPRTTRERVYREIEQATGLDVPGDLETLLGRSTTFAVGGDLDYEAAANAADPSHVPVGAVVAGDAPAIEAVLDTLRSSEADLPALLGSDSSGDLVAVGPSAGYRKDLLAGGHLGDTHAFRAVVPAPEHASEILFVDTDRFQKPLEEAWGSDQETADNLEPLQAIGFSAWVDGDLGRLSLEVSTD